MAIPTNLWVVVLAAGDGSRLIEWTRDGEGRPVPKQYYSFGAGESMLARTLARARQLVPAERILVVVAEQHREWWGRELGRFPAENIVVQPRNRGTAAGILLPLMKLVMRDPDAVVLVLPSDHFVDREEVLRQAVQRGLRHVAVEPWSVILLGIEPDDPDPEYGWILAAPAEGGVTRPVLAFVEKPNAAEAARLMAEGALVNSFIFLATRRQLVRLYEESQPVLLSRYLRNLRERGWGREAVEALYRFLPVRDFSRDLLQPMAAKLRLLPVPPCGWTDLGTPGRVARWLAARRRVAAATVASVTAAATVAAGARPAGARQVIAEPVEERVAV
jgi:mannose-1-phosphate guanylyltransferase